MLSMLSTLPLWKDTALGKDWWSTEMLEVSCLDNSVAVLRRMHLGQLDEVM